MTEQKPGAPWWQTLPGVLTATGTLIVAVTGLLGMLHQSGLLRGGSTAGKQPAGAEFVSVRSMSREGFQTKRDKFAGDGYAIESAHSYQNCKGVERYHVTWIKR